MTERTWPSPHSLKHVRHREMDLWCGTLSLPSCVDGAGLIPFPLYLRRVRVKAQTGKDLPATLHRLMPLTLSPFWDRDVMSVWEKVTCTSSYLRMSRSALLWLVCSLCISCLWIARWKRGPQSGGNWKGKTQLGDQWQGRLPLRLSSCETPCLIQGICRVAKGIMGVPGWSQARGGGGGRRPPMAKQPYLGLSFFT